MSMSINERHRERLGCLLIIITLSLPVCFCFLSLFGRQLFYTEFCTFDDEVFQAFRSEVNNLIEHFRSTDSLSASFTTPSGEEYIVLYGGHGEDAPPILYVATLPQLRNIFGVKGYVYSPDGPTKPDNRYEVVAFAGDIYCYSM